MDLFLVHKLIIAYLVKENYIIFRKYIKFLLPPLTEIVGSTMNLISGIHNFYERSEYTFNVLPKYNIITFINRL